jgi:hypothetical protein
MECNYCNSTFYNQKNLKDHQAKSEVCLANCNNLINKLHRVKDGSGKLDDPIVIFILNKQFEKGKVYNLIKDELINDINNCEEWKGFSKTKTQHHCKTCNAYFTHKKYIDNHVNNICVITKHGIVGGRIANLYFTVPQLYHLNEWEGNELTIDFKNKYGHFVSKSNNNITTNNIDAYINNSGKYNIKSLDIAAILSGNTFDPSTVNVNYC